MPVMRKNKLLMTYHHHVTILTDRQSHWPLCTLSQSRNTSSLPVHEPPTLSMRQIFSSAAHGASV